MTALFSKPKVPPPPPLPDLPPPVAPPPPPLPPSQSAAFERETLRRKGKGKGGIADLVLTPLGRAANPIAPATTLGGG